ncbi:MAG: hypothetical protein VYA34_01865 [Myxococcota bacterium]|nr:hypothetical protein [Myxococcota bacterium]
MFRLVLYCLPILLATCETSWAKSPITVQTDVRIGFGTHQSNGLLLTAPGFSVFDETTLLSLSFPIWIENSSKANGWATIHPWDSFGSYSGIIEALEIKAFSNKLVLKLGALSYFDLGEGNLVRDYSTVSDPSLPQSGLHTRWESSRFTLEFFANNFMAPNVMGAALRSYPFLVLGADPNRRIAFTAELATDVGTGTANDGASGIAEGAFGGNLYLIRNPTLTWLARANAIITNHGGNAFRGNIRFEWNGPQQRKNLYFVEIDSLISSPNYAPFYFDEAYEYERSQLLAQSQNTISTNSDVTQWHIASRIGFAGSRFSSKIGIKASLAGKSNISFAARYRHERLQLQLNLHRRALVKLENFFTARGSFLATVDSSWRIFRNLFIFALFHCGPSHLYSNSDQGAKPPWFWVTGFGIDGTYSKS